MLREPLTLNPEIVEEIVAREEEYFRRRTPRSHEIHERAKSLLPMGVSSSFQAVQPYPLFISHAQGSHIWDYDGNEYVDFHLGFGSLLVGHAHPLLVEALRDQLGKGSLYSLPMHTNLRKDELPEGRMDMAADGMGPSQRWGSLSSRLCRFPCARATSLRCVLERHRLQGEPLS